MEKDFIVVGVISSPRPGGNTAAMVREALKGAEDEGAVIREIFLPDIKMGFCQGCLTCMKNGKCYMDDGFNGLRDTLREADGIIWGSPTYAANVNAMMKNLIDRLGMLEVSTSSLGGKYMAGISAANSAGAARKVAASLARFGNGGTFSRSYNSGHLGEGFSGGRKAGEEKTVLARARKLGRKVARDIKNEEKYTFQSIPGRIFSSLIMKPAFSKYIKANKEGDAKIMYESLKARNLID